MGQAVFNEYNPYNNMLLRNTVTTLTVSDRIDGIISIPVKIKMIPKTG
jgi:hypothetical protein